MTLKKIRVQDSDRNFHSFKGEDIMWSRDGQTYDIFRYKTMNDGDRERINIASFIYPGFVKYIDLDDTNDNLTVPSDNMPQDPDNLTPPPLDDWTQRELDQREHTEPEQTEMEDVIVTPPPEKEGPAPDVDVDKVIEEAEQKHQERMEEKVTDPLEEELPK